MAGAFSKDCYNSFMHWLLRAAFVVLGNAFALWLVNHYLASSGFVLTSDWKKLILIALILSILNFLLKPVLTLILGPIIVVTLGIGVIIVNALILYLLYVLANHIDILQGSITIYNIPALIYGTLIVSAVNFILHLVF